MQIVDFVILIPQFFIEKEESCLVRSFFLNKNHGIRMTKWSICMSLVDNVDRLTQRGLGGFKKTLGQGWVRVNDRGNIL